MGLALTLALLALWLTLAFRAFQRGDVLLAALLLAVGVGLTVYRLRRLNRPVARSNPDDPTLP
jgi:hypothetical protein